MNKSKEYATLKKGIKIMKITLSLEKNQIDLRIRNSDIKFRDGGAAMLEAITPNHIRVMAGAINNKPPESSNLRDPITS